MAELGDPQSFKRGLRELMGEAAKSEIEAAVHDAVDRSDRILREVARDPPPGATMESWALESIADSVETYWSPSEPEGKLAQGDAYVAEYTHPHADKIEVGVRPHQIEGSPILVFPWYNAPDEVVQQFQPQWDNPDSWLEEPQVVFAEVEHPGIPGVGYIRGGFQYALRKHGWL